MIRSVAGNLANLGATFWAKKLFSNILSLGLKVVSSKIGKKLIHENIKRTSELYKLGTSKIENKNVRRALESDVSDYIVQETQKKSTESRL